MNRAEIINELAETLPTFVPELRDDQARVEDIARQLADHLTATLSN